MNQFNHQTQVRVIVDLESAKAHRIINRRHRLYIMANPDQRCLKCALRLGRHTVEEFMYCEFVLAGSGSETLVMNKPAVSRET